MAKREIPEINAGSMADIAFLLLLFFLVTTTMDKDQAYIRVMPKPNKVQQPNEVQQRDILAIKANDNILRVRGETFDDPNKISDFVLKFYQTNEKKNDLTNEYPLYSTTTLSMCDKGMDLAEKNMEEAEQKNAKEQAEFFRQQLEEWGKKKRAIELYGKSEMREISIQAHIRIEVQNGTPYSIFVRIHNEIEEAIFELRDKECNRMFREQYSILKRRSAQDCKKIDKDKIDLLEILYPAVIIEVQPK